MRKLTSERFALVLLAVLFFSITVIANGSLPSLRFDLTEDDLFSLSDGTRAVLAELDEPITLRFYFSATLANNYPGLRTYGERVREMLEEYESAAAGKVDLLIYDPEPFTDTQDQADQYGLQAVRAEASQFLYFGLVATNSTDDQEIISYFSVEREAFLEYDLTKAILGLSSRERPEIGILSALPLATGAGSQMDMMQGFAQPLTLYTQLSEFFSTAILPDSFTHVPDSIDVLLLAAPPELDAETLYAIDQFVLAGGRVLAFVDPFAELLKRPDPSGMRSDQTVANIDNLAPLLNAWGIDISPEEVLADRRLAQQVSTYGTRGPEIVDYIIWLAITRDNVNATDVITGNVATLNFATAGHILTLDTATTTIEPLITSSSEAMLLTPDYLDSQPEPQSLLREFRPTGESYTMAVRISGPSSSAFPDGPPNAEAVDDIEAEQDPLPAHLSQSTGDINVIVIADSDLFDDRFWVTVQNFLGQQIVTPSADNGSFVINAVDNLAGSGELISLRSRGTVHRPFTAIETIRQDAEFRYLAREQALLDKLAATDQRIQELGQVAVGGVAGLSNAETEAELAAFRQEMIATRRELRDVQVDLRQDIERLQTLLKVLNIALMPALFGFLAFVIAAFRRRRSAAGTVS